MVLYIFFNYIGYLMENEQHGEVNLPPTSEPTSEPTSLYTNANPENNLDLVSSSISCSPSLSNISFPVDTDHAVTNLVSKTAVVSVSTCSPTISFPVVTGAASTNLVYQTAVPVTVSPSYVSSPVKSSLVCSNPVLKTHTVVPVPVCSPSPLNVSSPVKTYPLL